MGVNDDLQDRFIEHDVDLLRLQEHHRQLILQDLRRLETRLVQQLAQLPATSEFTKARTAALLRQVQKTIQSGYKQVLSTHTGAALELAAFEAEQVAKIVNQKVGASVMSVGVPQSVVESLVQDDTVLGAPLRKIWQQEAGALNQAFISTMRQGILAGDTTQQLIQRVSGTQANNYKDGIMDPRKRNVEMRVRTSAQSILNDARLEAFRANADLMRGVQAQATLDDRTSEICMARSGMAWTMEGEPLNEETDEDFPGPPPWHPNCRTTLIPVLKSLGEVIGQPELDTKVEKELRKLPKGTQASMDGQVPAGLTYEQWLRTKSEAFQKSVLGPGKWTLWHEGKIGLKDLIDQKGRPLTIAQLKKLGPGGRGEGGLGAPLGPPAPPGLGPPSPFRPATPEAFLEAREQPNPHSSYLSPLTKEELSDKTLFLTEDHKVGFLLDPTKDFGNLFNSGGARGLGKEAIVKAVEEGALTLDAFDGYLPQLYSRYGFRVTGRMKFDDKLAPPNWNYARDGRPDVVFMSYQGGLRGTLKSRVGTFPEYLPKSGRYYTHYDSAKLNSRRAALAGADDSGARRKLRPGELASPTASARIREKPLGATSADFPRANPAGQDTLEWYTQADGAFTEERVMLHEAIREVTFQTARPVQRPVSYILGGGPASGKSTLLDSGLVTIPKNHIRIDPDAIKGMLPEYHELLARGDEFGAALTHEESSRLSKVFLTEAGERGFNTVLDGTGDGTLDGLTKKVQALRARGQKVIAHYVTVPTETALARAAARAKITGRKVPTEQIVKTHQAVSTVFPQAVKRGLFDEFALWDNSGAKPLLIAEGKGTDLTVHHLKLWEDFLKKATAPLPNDPETIRQGLIEGLAAATKRVTYTYDPEATRLLSTRTLHGGDLHKTLDTVAESTKDAMAKELVETLGGEQVEKHLNAVYEEVWPRSAKYDKDDYPRQFVERIANRWMSTSADHDVISITMQLAAREYFNMAKGAMSHMDADVVRQAQKLYRAHRPLFDAMVRMQYQRTQLWLKNHGITHVTVYRGVKGLSVAEFPEDNIIREKIFTHQPLSSWSLDHETANGFGYTLIAEVVPASHVYGVPHTAMGVASEGEWVILGLPRHAVYRTRSGFETETQLLPFLEALKTRRARYD